MLGASGLKDNTILVFMTDNGGTVGVSHYNAGMRGRKTSLYEGGHRVPCLIRWPEGDLGSPRDIGELVQVQDILPTLLELCRTGAGEDFDGTSIAGLLKEGVQEELRSRMLVVQYGRQPYERLELPSKYDACVMWNKWRLVNNTELYDIGRDPGQTEDLAEAHPGIAGRMAAFYEDWWEDAEPLVCLDPLPVWIGTKQEPVTRLTSHDWLAPNTANQLMIRKGRNRSGDWHVYVVQKGTYRIGLRRWPAETGAGICSGMPDYRVADKTVTYPQGIALPVARANLRVGFQEYSVKVKEGDAAAVFRVPLKEGNTTLRGEFYNSEGDRLCGAYYVYITREH
jgi:hypothetical protein